MSHAGEVEHQRVILLNVDVEENSPRVCEKNKMNRGMKSTLGTCVRTENERTEKRACPHSGRERDDHSERRSNDTQEETERKRERRIKKRSTGRI